MSEMTWLDWIGLATSAAVILFAAGFLVVLLVGLVRRAWR